MPHSAMHVHIDYIRSHANGMGLVGMVLMALTETVSGHLPGSELIQILAASLTSAAIAVSAALWVMNLLIDRRLNEFEREVIEPKYSNAVVCEMNHSSGTSNYAQLFELLTEIRKSQIKAQAILDPEKEE